MAFHDEGSPTLEIKNRIVPKPGVSGSPSHNSKIGSEVGARFEKSR